MLSLGHDEFYKMFHKHPAHIEIVKLSGPIEKGLAVDAYADKLKFRLRPIENKGSLPRHFRPSISLVMYCNKCMIESEFHFHGLDELGEILTKYDRCQRTRDCSSRAFVMANFRKHGLKKLNKNPSPFDALLSTG